MALAYVNPIDEDLDRPLDSEYLAELAPRMTEADWADFMTRKHVSPSQWALVIAGSERLGVSYDFSDVMRRNGVHEEMVDWAREVIEHDDLYREVKAGGLSLLAAYVVAKSETMWTEARDAVIRELETKFPGMHAAYEAGEAPLETVLELVDMEIPPEPDAERLMSLAYDWTHAARHGTATPRRNSTTWPYQSSPQRRRGRRRKKR